jgi:hypothetical protein
MVRELGLFSVAEGIEKEERAVYLREHSIDFGQGQLFSRPLPAEEFIVFHRQNKSRYGSAPEVIQVASVEVKAKTLRFPRIGRYPTSSSVITSNRLSIAGPNAVDSATSVASRPVAINMRPMRGVL